MQTYPEPVIFRGKFRNLKLRAMGEPAIVACELEMELRSLRSRPHLFIIFWRENGRPVSERPHLLKSAQRIASDMFQEQIEPWHQVEKGAS